MINIYDDALYILNVLNGSGFDAYIVGGYPRDKYLNILSEDFDICTSATPKEVAVIFKECDLSFSKFGRADIYLRGHIYQVTTFRKDICYDERRMPTIRYVNSLTEDIKRRDFTINTLLIDSKGNYIDVCGAKEDIENKIIRTVKNASESIVEDPLRILRALRFSIKFGFVLDDELELAINSNKGLLKNISSRKIRHEIEKMMDIDEEKSKDLLKTFNLEKYCNSSNRKFKKRIQSKQGR